MVQGGQRTSQGLGGGRAPGAVGDAAMGHECAGACQRFFLSGVPAGAGGSQRRSHSRSGKSGWVQRHFGWCAVEERM